MMLRTRLMSVPNGAGTTGLVTDHYVRHCIGIELNPEYVGIAERHLRNDAMILADIVVAA